MHDWIVNHITNSDVSMIINNFYSFFSQSNLRDKHFLTLQKPFMMSQKRFHHQNYQQGFKIEVQVLVRCQLTILWSVTSPPSGCFSQLWLWWWWVELHKYVVEETKKKQFKEIIVGHFHSCLFSMIPPLILWFSYTLSNLLNLTNTMC